MLGSRLMNLVRIERIIRRRTEVIESLLDVENCSGDQVSYFVNRSLHVVENVLEFVQRADIDNRSIQKVDTDIRPYLTKTWDYRFFGSLTVSFSRDHVNFIVPHDRFRPVSRMIRWYVRLYESVATLRRFRFNFRLLLNLIILGISVLLSGFGLYLFCLSFL